MSNVIDEFTLEALAIAVDRAIDADGVVDVLDRLVLQHGAPYYVRIDNSPGFIAYALRELAIQQCCLTLLRFRLAVAERLDRIIERPTAR